MRSTLTPLFSLLLVFFLAFVGCASQSPIDESTTPDGGSVTQPDTQLPDVQLASCEWDESTATTITLSGTSITADAPTVTVEGSTVTITGAGTYLIKGQLTDGQIVVQASDADAVKLLLGGVDLSSTKVAPIHIKEAEKVELILLPETTNKITGGTTSDGGEDAPNAAIYSKTDMTVCGSGALSITGASGDGLTGKDDLMFLGGTIDVSAKDDGIRGKDALVIKSATIKVTAGGDGLKSDNAEDPAKGYILVESGTLHVTSGGDGIAAEGTVSIKDGKITLIAGGGSTNQPSQETSQKGIKSTTHIALSGGQISIDAADDGVHSNGTLQISGGTLSVSSGDDGVHSDTQMDITGGTIKIAKSYEGIESRTRLNITGGDIHIVASDDGLNVAGGNDGSALPGATGRPGGGGPGGGGSAASCDCYLHVSGGTIVVNASGDGVDVNGTITMSSGTIIVHGPTANNNGGMDYDGDFTMTGGLLIAASSAGMPQTAGSNSTQHALLIGLTSSQPAGTLFHIQDSDGNAIVTFAPQKQYQTVAFSSPKLESGKTYYVYYGGSASGEAKDGVYTGGTYTPGTQDATFTISGIVTSVNVNSRGGRP